VRILVHIGPGSLEELPSLGRVHPHASPGQDAQRALVHLGLLIFGKNL
jgi:hypothetical protein